MKKNRISKKNKYFKLISNKRKVNSNIKFKKFNFENLKLKLVNFKKNKKVYYSYLFVLIITIIIAAALGVKLSEKSTIHKTDMIPIRYDSSLDLNSKNFNLFTHDTASSKSGYEVLDNGAYVSNYKFNSTSKSPENVKYTPTITFFSRHAFDGGKSNTLFSFKLTNNWYSETNKNVKYIDWSTKYDFKNKWFKNTPKFLQNTTPEISNYFEDSDNNIYLLSNVGLWKYNVSDHNITGIFDNVTSKDPNKAENEAYQYQFCNAFQLNYNNDKKTDSNIWFLAEHDNQEDKHYAAFIKTKSDDQAELVDINKRLSTQLHNNSMFVTSVFTHDKYNNLFIGLQSQYAEGNKYNGLYFIPHSNNANNYYLDWSKAKQIFKPSMTGTSNLPLYFQYLHFDTYVKNRLWTNIFNAGASTDTTLEKYQNLYNCNLEYNSDYTSIQIQKWNSYDNDNMHDIRINGMNENGKGNIYTSSNVYPRYYSGKTNKFYEFNLEDPNIQDLEGFSEISRIKYLPFYNSIIIYKIASSDETTHIFKINLDNLENAVNKTIQNTPDTNIVKLNVNDDNEIKLKNTLYNVSYSAIYSVILDQNNVVWFATDVGLFGNPVIINK